MTELTDHRLQSLVVAIDESNNRGPWCSGSKVVPQKDLNLFFRRDKSSDARCIDLTTATQQELQELTAACEPATFGRNQEDVYDETYRKAGKMNVENFAINFRPESSGIAALVTSELLRWEDENRAVSFELYKLNVYGQDSFFKAHKDTPRGEKMFASLVVVLSVAHEGGGLLLRHNEQEHLVDVAQTLKGEPQGTVVYAAFYSDVEHEVLKVISGHRITLTYNMYFVDRPTPLVAISPAKTSPIFKIVDELLRDPHFMPQGGVLGFGLKHEYPVENTGSTYSKRANLEALKNSLKGADAAIARAWMDCGINMSLKLIYELVDEWKYLLMCDQALNFDWAPDDIVDDIKRTQGDTVNAKVIVADDPTYHMHEKDLDVTWVTPLTKLTTFEGAYPTYGNEVSIDYLYGHVALIVCLGPFGDRKNFVPIKPKPEPPNTVQE